MEFKEEVHRVKDAYDIVDYIKANGVDLQISGIGHWKGLCPFHNEKTPSFTVSEGFQNYKCFGCGESGDIISFAEHTHTISFKEALKMLAEEKSIPLNNNVLNESSHDINAIRQVVADAEEFFKFNYYNLDETHPAKQEVLKRGLNVNNELYGFSLEAPNALYKYLNKKGHLDKNIKDSNLVLFYDDRPPWDFFHGRLMITLKDYLGRPVSFTSRKIYEDDKMQGKYVNGKESPVFHKKNILFGADIAKRKARSSNVIYVVEGQFDQIAMYEKGIENVVATSGTAFTNEHANLLLRMVGKAGKVVFIMDGDEAGVQAAIKVFTTAKTLHSNAYAVLLEDGKDPCDYIEEGGIELLQKAIDKANPLHDFVINSVLIELNNTINIDNRHTFVAKVAQLAKNTEDSYIVDEMLGKASVLSAITIDNVREIYNKTEGDRVRVKKDEVEKETQLKPSIKLNFNDEADICMFSALALLVRIPQELVPITPKIIHKKFRPFLKELGQRYVDMRNNNRSWRFIPEDYSDSDFALALQNKSFLELPEEDIKSSINQYKFLFTRANDLYKDQYQKMELAKSLSSIVDTTDAKKVAEVLKMYEESREQLDYN